MQALDDLGDLLEIEAAVGQNARRLVDAPTGSGKTLLCTRLVARFVVQQVALLKDRASDAANTSSPSASPGNMTSTFPQMLGKLPALGSNTSLSLGASSATHRMLVITPSAMLVHDMAVVVAAALHEAGTLATTTPPCVAGAALNPIPTHVRLQPLNFPTIEVCLMTMDTFIEQARLESIGTFASAAVDEGQVCFSYQTDPDLDGQHQCEDPSAVSLFFEKALAPAATTPQHSVPVIIFRNNSCQLSSAASPAYPADCIETMLPLPIMRNPGPVRDASVPFDTVLSAFDHDAHDGRQSYYPVHAEASSLTAPPPPTRKGKAESKEIAAGTDHHQEGANVPVRFVNVEPAEIRAEKIGAYECAVQLTEETSLRIAEESHTQSRNYARQIVAELARMHEEAIAGNLPPDWATEVAVLFPGTPSGLPAQLLRGMHDAAMVRTIRSSKTHAIRKVSAVAVENMLPTNPGHGPTGLYVGAVENFAGLDRARIIVAGMQQPEYLLHRKACEGWTPDWENRADPRMYLAITRCTVELVLVEVEVAWFAAHFSVSKSINNGTCAPYIGERRLADQVNMAMIEPPEMNRQGRCFLRLGISVDLEHPPSQSELTNIGAVFIPMADPAGWKKTTFEWSHCTKGVFEICLCETFAGLTSDSVFDDWDYGSDSESDIDNDLDGPLWRPSSVSTSADLTSRVQLRPHGKSQCSPQHTPLPPLPLILFLLHPPPFL
jgi:hypothetical protein